MSAISSLVREIMDSCGLTQRDLAATLGVPLDRVKSLSSGKVQKLTSEESQALVARLGIRPDWIVGGGQGRMRMTQHEHAQWLAAHAMPPELQQAVHRAQERAPAWPDGKPPHGKAEVELIANWRACGKADRETVSALAARLAKP